MHDIIDGHTDEMLEEWEESGVMATWETAFLRGTDMAFDDHEFAEEEL